MATELDISKIKSGDTLYFKSSGRFPYWSPESPNPPVMDKIFENVLEGQVYSPGFYPFKRKWADDADEAPIDASKVGGSAGVYLGVSEIDSALQTWLKVDFPFTFYNRDGSNHDQKSTTVAWVKLEDVEIKEDMETRLKNLLGTDPLDKKLVDNSGNDQKKSSAWGLLVAFFALVGGGLYFWNKNKKDKMALAYQQTTAQSSLQRPQFKNVRL